MTQEFPRAIELAAAIVSSHVCRTETKSGELASILDVVYCAIKDLERREASPSVPDEAAAASDASSPQGSVSAGEPASSDSPLENDRTSGFVRDGKRTLGHDRLLCLDDDREVTFLGRHLRSIGTTEDDYRSRWSLPQDYPMTAPAYVESRRDAAAKSGFGKTIRPLPRREVQPIAPIARMRRDGTLSLQHG